MSKLPDNVIPVEVNRPEKSLLRGSVFTSRSETPIFIRGYRAAAPIRRWVDHHLTNFTDDLIAAAYERHFDSNSRMWVSLASKARTAYKKYLLRIESEVIMVSGVEKNWGFKPILSPWHDSNWLFWTPRYSRPALGWMRSHLFSPQFSEYGGDNINQFMQEANTG